MYPILAIVALRSSPATAIISRNGQSQGTGNGQFSDPQSIAVDSTGNFIYVADNGNDRIEVFVSNPNTVPPIITKQPACQTVPAGANVTFSVGVVGTAPFAYQWSSNSIAISSATNATFTLTNVSFADSASYSVLVTNSYGSELSSNALLAVLPVAEFVVPAYLFQIDSSAVPGGFQPNSVALDDSNNVYRVTSDTLNNRVLKFAGNGNYLTQWGSSGSGNGQFSDPQGVAVDSSNNVYVADGSNNRVEKFDSNGNYLTRWGSQGTGNGQFEGLVGIAVDSSNNVYVVDGNNERVEKFDSNGNDLTQWGSPGTSNGQFEQPFGIAVDSSNNVYVIDEENDRVEKFTSNGMYLTQWGSAGSGAGQFGGLYGIAVDSSNNVYVTDLFNQRVQKFDSNGNYLTQWGTAGSGAGQFGDPFGIAVDSTGNFIYVTDNGNDRIEVFVSNPNIVPPIITSQPASQTVPAGASVTFSVGVVGTASFAYQWSSNGIAISGATNATFTLTDVSFADSASYSVLVTNSYGSELSSNAMLALLPAVVTTQPASSITTTGAVLNGSPITFRFR